MVRGGERFNKDVPPFVSAYGTSLVSGINSIGLKRAGFSAEDRLEIKRAFKLVYRSGFNISQAIEESKGVTWGPEAQFFLDFIATAKKRGVSSVARRGMSPATDEE
jgi:UDP-N-acetylglucosamine acyltransferase